MTSSNASKGPREPSSLTPGARRISSEHLARLRAIVADAGSVHGASPLLKASAEIILDALTFKTFRAKSAEALESKIDHLGSLALSPPAAESARTLPTE